MRSILFAFIAGAVLSAPLLAQERNEDQPTTVEESRARLAYRMDYSRLAARDVEQRGDFFIVKGALVPIGPATHAFIAPFIQPGSGLIARVWLWNTGASMQLVSFWWYPAFGTASPRVNSLMLVPGQRTFWIPPDPNNAWSVLVVARGRLEVSGTWFDPWDFHTSSFVPFVRRLPEEVELPNLPFSRTTGR